MLIIPGKKDTSHHFKRRAARWGPGNYRPVSLISPLAKCIESFIREDVIEHMMANNLFSDDQHGFVLGRSCMTQPPTVLRDLTNGLALGEIIDVLYTDFSKAFDSVSHVRLFSKFE